MDEKNWFQVHCSICPATWNQCKKQNIACHEISNSHKDKAAAWLKKQQALVGWQGQFNKGADYTAFQRVAQAADPKLHTQFACVFKTLQQRMQTLLQQAAAMSLSTSQKQQNPSPPPGPSLSQRVLGGSHALKGAGQIWGVVEGSRVGMVMMPGSVEDERMLSTLKYIRNPQRNRLHAQHLTSCARGFKSSALSVKSIPYP